MSLSAWLLVGWDTEHISGILGQQKSLRRSGQKLRHGDRGRSSELRLRARLSSQNTDSTHESEIESTEVSGLRCTCHGRWPAKCPFVHPNTALNRTRILFVPLFPVVPNKPQKTFPERLYLPMFLRSRRLCSTTLGAHLPPNHHLTVHAWQTRLTGHWYPVWSTSELPRQHLRGELPSFAYVSLHSESCRVYVQSRPIAPTVLVPQVHVLVAT